MMGVVSATALLWMTSEFWAPRVGQSGRAGSAMVAIAMALLCFLLPSRRGGKLRLLEWEWTVRVPWGVLFLFGGGLALSQGMQASGLDGYLAESLAGVLAHAPGLFVKMLGVALFTAVLTQMMSNFAVAQMVMPMLFQVASQLGVEAKLMVLPGMLGAYCSFLLPASTPPNAIVFGTGKVTVTEMMKAGAWLAAAGVVAAVVCVWAAAGR
jgi:sodium-dependent dicarboxylate transporter 2/3/5